MSEKPYRQKRLLKAIDLCVKQAHKIDYIMGNRPESGGSVVGLYSDIVMWLPKEVVRFVPLMSDADLCVLCRISNPGRVTELIRKAAKEKTEHIDGMDGYEALDLIRVRQWEPERIKRGAGPRERSASRVIAWDNSAEVERRRAEMRAKR